MAAESEISIINRFVKFLVEDNKIDALSMIQNGEIIPQKHFERISFLIITDQSAKTVQNFLDIGGPINNNDRYFYNSLHLCFSTRIELLEKIKLFVSKGANITRISKDGYTLLERAVIRKDVKVAEYLLQSGFDIDTVSILDGGTALSFASAFKSTINIMKLLLFHGADMNIVNNDEKRAIDIARNRNNHEAVEILEATQENRYKKELDLQKIAYLQALISETDMSLIHNYIKDENHEWLLYTYNDLPIVVQAKQKLYLYDQSRKRKQREEE